MSFEGPFGPGVRRPLFQLRPRNSLVRGRVPKKGASVMLRTYVSSSDDSSDDEAVQVRFTGNRRIETLDTEISATIGSIRRYVERNNPGLVFCGIPFLRIELYYRNRRLDNDHWTLADYGWVNGMTGNIVVRRVI